MKRILRRPRTTSHGFTETESEIGFGPAHREDPGCTKVGIDKHRTRRPQGSGLSWRWKSASKDERTVEEGQSPRTGSSPSTETAWASASESSDGVVAVTTPSDTSSSGSTSPPLQPVDCIQRSRDDIQRSQKRGSFSQKAIAAAKNPVAAGAEWWKREKIRNGKRRAETCEGLFDQFKATLPSSQPIVQCEDKVAGLIDHEMAMARLRELVSLAEAIDQSIWHDGPSYWNEAGVQDRLRYAREHSYLEDHVTACDCPAAMEMRKNAARYAKLEAMKELLQEQY